MGLRIRKTSKFGRNSAVHGESTQAQSKRAILKMLGKHVTFFINPRNYNKGISEKV